MTGEDIDDDDLDLDMDDYEVYRRDGVCCTCRGCLDYPHVCDRSDEERTAERRRRDESIAAILKGPPRHRLSDGSEIMVGGGGVPAAVRELLDNE